jgi:hypothetical protein
MALHRWASGGSGGSSRVTAWILKPAAAAAAKISAMMIQIIGRRSSYPCPLGATYHYGNRARPGGEVRLFTATQPEPLPRRP